MMQPGWTNTHSWTEEHIRTNTSHMWTDASGNGLHVKLFFRSVLLTVESCAKTSVTSTHCMDARLRVSRLETQGWCHIHDTCAAACTKLYQSEAGTRSWKPAHISASCGPVNETAADCADLKYPMHKLWCWVWTQSSQGEGQGSMRA